jgi:hypothetical protein
MRQIADFHGYEGPRYPAEPWTEEEYPLFLVKTEGELVYLDPRDWDPPTGRPAPSSG